MNRRSFLRRLAALVAAATAAPAILARLRPSWETADPDAWASGSVPGESPFHFSDNYFVSDGIVTLHTSHGIYRAPMVGGVADFSAVCPVGCIITGVSQAGGPIVLGQLKF